MSRQYDSQQYDAIGELYERAKQLPIGQAEQSTLLAALPAACLT